MRVRFGNFTESEKRELSELDARARKAFAALPRVNGDPAKLKAWAAHVHPGLGAELAADGVLVVRALSPELVPVAERVVSLAPPSLEVQSHRPAVPVPAALARLPRLGAVDFANARVRAGFSRGHLLELVVFLPGGSGNADERSLAERLVWDIAGERRANHWIGAVEVAAAPRKGPLKVLPVAGKDDERGFALSELPASLDAAIAALTTSLPESPLWADGGGDWTMFELEPEPAADFFEKDDLVMAVTRVPELLKCYLEHAPFASLRFSRHAETFFHLKYESGGEPEERLARRERLERALDRELSGARVGRVVGGGLGLRYSYLDLALSALAPGFEITQRVALAEELPARSWLEPFDSELAAEWLGLWPDSPAPPKRHSAG